MIPEYPVAVQGSTAAVCKKAAMNRQLLLKMMIRQNLRNPAPRCRLETRGMGHEKWLRTAGREEDLQSDAAMALSTHRRLLLTREMKSASKHLQRL
jgi:hypothetical protein